MRVAIIGYGKLGAAVAEVAEKNGWTVVARVNKGTNGRLQTWGQTSCLKVQRPTMP